MEPKYYTGLFSNRKTLAFVSILRSSITADARSILSILSARCAENGVSRTGLNTHSREHDPRITRCVTRAYRVGIPGITSGELRQFACWNRKRGSLYGRMMFSSHEVLIGEVEDGLMDSSRTRFFEYRSEPKQKLTSGFLAVGRIKSSSDG